MPKSKKIARRPMRQPSVNSMQIGSLIDKIRTGFGVNSMTFPLNVNEYAPYYPPRRPFPPTVNMDEIMADFFSRVGTQINPADLLRSDMPTQEELDAAPLTPSGHRPLRLTQPNDGTLVDWSPSMPAKVYTPERQPTQEELDAAPLTPSGHRPLRLTQPNDGTLADWSPSMPAKVYTQEDYEYFSRLDGDLSKRNYAPAEETTQEPVSIAYQLAGITPKRYKGIANLLTQKSQQPNY